MQNTKLGFLAKILPFLLPQYYPKVEKLEGVTVLKGDVAIEQAMMNTELYGPQTRSVLESFLARERIKHSKLVSDKGASANTFAHPSFPNSVIKVTTRCDRAYMKWMEEFVLNNQSNPHVPQVTLYARDDKDLVLVIMERLEESRVNGYGTPYLASFPSETYESVKGLVWRDLGDDVHMSVPAELVDIIQFLKTAKSDLLIDIDMHPGNAMLRNGTELVITDPLI